MSDQPAGAVLERFKPTIGRWLGIVGLGLLAILAVAIGTTGLDTATIVALVVIALVAVLVLSALVRPRINAYEDHLLLRNAWSDVRIAWHSISDVDVRQTLRVYVGTDLHHGVAIGKSTRKLLKGNLRGGSLTSTMFGSSRGDELASRPTLMGADVRGMQYADYVVIKIGSYSSAQAHASQDREPVTRTWAWPYIVPAAVLLLLAVILPLAA